MQDVEKRRAMIINVIYLAMLVAIGFLIIRYALGVCFPFLFAFLAAALLQRPKNFLVRKTFLKDGAASVICVFLLLFVVLALVSLIGVRLFARIQDFVNYLALQFQNMEDVIANIEKWLLSVIEKLPEFLRKTLSENTSELFAKLNDYFSASAADTAEAAAVAGTEAAETTKSALAGLLGGNFKLSWLTTPLSSLLSTAKQIPSALIAVVITLVASCFMTTEFPKVMQFFRLQVPERRRNDLDRAKVLLKSSLGKMGKAYALIMLVTFIEMSLGLTVLRLIGVFQSNYIIMISAVTAIIDIVPVLGTGTILLPWAAYSLITGSFGRGIGLLVIYAAITVIRQVIEPKLVAGQLGLSPVVTIAALYFGLKIFGVPGMLITPVLIIMLKLLNDEGIIHLWRSPARAKKESEAAAAPPAEDPPEEGPPEEGPPEEDPSEDAPPTHPAESL